MNSRSTVGALRLTGCLRSYLYGSGSFRPNTNQQIWIPNDPAQSILPCLRPCGSRTKPGAGQSGSERCSVEPGRFVYHSKRIYRPITRPRTEQRNGGDSNCAETSSPNSELETEGGRFSDSNSAVRIPSFVGIRSAIDDSQTAKHVKTQKYYRESQPKSQDEIDDVSQFTAGNPRATPRGSQVNSGRRSRVSFRHRKRPVERRPARRGG